MSFVAPNWRNKLEYPDPSIQKNLSFWAWEFLRRNISYQNAWDEYVRQLREKVEQFPDLKMFVNNLLSERPACKIDEEGRFISLYLKEPNFISFSAPPFAGESIEDWKLRMNDLSIEADLLKIDKLMGEPWGLERIINPMTRYSIFNVNWLKTGSALTRILGPTKRFEGENYFVTPFDLRYPVDVLKSQFEAILRKRDWLIKNKKIEKYSARPEKSLMNFTNYLRTLDAINEKVSIADIARHIFPDEDADGAKKKVNNWRVRATVIMNEEYKIFPLYSHNW